MTQELILMILAGAGTVLIPLVGWIVFYKPKKLAFLTRMRGAKAEDDKKLYDTLDTRIEELGTQVHKLRDDLFESINREQTMKSHIGVLFNHCECTDAEEVKQVRTIYNE